MQTAVIVRNTSYSCHTPRAQASVSGGLLKGSRVRHRQLAIVSVEVLIPNRITLNVAALCVSLVPKPSTPVSQFWAARLLFFIDLTVEDCVLTFVGFDGEDKIHADSYSSEKHNPSSSYPPGPSSGKWG